MQWSDGQNKELLEAIFTIQSSVGPVVKNAKNPHFKNNYATLDAVWSQIAPLLQENGLVVVQGGGHDGSHPVLFTEIRHVDTGQYVRASHPLYGGKSDPQGIGSAVTYARRYSLCSMFGLMVADDDGNHASGHGAQQRKQPPPKQQKPSGPPAPFDEDTVLAGHPWGTTPFKGKKVGAMPNDGLAKLLEAVRVEREKASGAGAAPWVGYFDACETNLRALMEARGMDAVPF